MQCTWVSRGFLQFHALIPVFDWVWDESGKCSSPAAAVGSGRPTQLQWSTKTRVLSVTKQMALSHHLSFPTSPSFLPSFLPTHPLSLHTLSPSLPSLPLPPILPSSLATFTVSQLIPPCLKLRWLMYVYHDPLAQKWTSIQPHLTLKDECQDLCTAVLREDQRTTSNVSLQLQDEQVPESGGETGRE